MSQKLQPVRGTQDLLPEMAKSFRLIDRIAFETAERFGYEEISTPIFEFSDVFHRTLGETSDAVTKETYTFLDRGGDEITLRPEGTAGIARAFISNGLQQHLPLKLYYAGPMFRYERPQKGRYRQFHQLGVECLGLESPLADVECLALASQLFKNLNLQDKVQLEINSLGDHESRSKHKDLLVEYLNDFTTQLSVDSQARLIKNPLRILDSKDTDDQKILLNAPSLSSCLNEASKQFFGQVLEGLKNLEITYVVNDKLVRGLDYYTHTVFEYTTSLLGAQSAVLAGGRYDGLIELMGGPKTPGVGWASGMERLSLLVDAANFSYPKNIIAILSADDKADNFCMKLTHDLRHQKFQCELISGGNVGKKMKRANKIGASFALIVGETELLNGVITVKDLKQGEQKTVSVIDVATAIQPKN
jgi:histidyl-tRNA synthetase